jgi:hypothetical protein
MSRHQPVAFAGRFLERRSADNTNDPASMRDRPAAVKRSGDARHIGARHAKHLRKRLLGERQIRLPEPTSAAGGSNFRIWLPRATDVARPPAAGPLPVPNEGIPLSRMSAAVAFVDQLSVY